MSSVVDFRISRDSLVDVIETKLQDLPPLPMVLMKLTESLNDPSTSVADLNRLLSCDQAMSAKMLRLVNSSYYGSLKITTITRAIVALGFNTIRTMAMSLGMGQMFKAGVAGKLDREQFWAHSVGTAACAWVIARKRNLDAATTEEAFVGGLLHDLGKLFLDQYFPEQYAAALDLAHSADISIWEAEKKEIGMGHALVGKRIAEHWRLPSSLTAMIATHHQPATVTDHFELVAVTHAADCLARKLEFGNPGDSLRPPIDPRVNQWLGFSMETWEQVEIDASRKAESTKVLIEMAH